MHPLPRRLPAAITTLLLLLASGNAL
ncbi:MAG: hypothetical protein RL375_2805, partial [Pseudomonadota bacterium]